MNEVAPIRDRKAIKQMLDYAKKQSERDFMLLMLGLNTGLRIGDILQLKVKDIKYKKHINIIEQKTNKTKHFLINDELKKHLKPYIVDKKDNEYLFMSRQGENKPITRQRAYQIIREIGDTFGLEDIGCHSLRKTFGYWHYKEFKDVVLLQKIFNHSTPEYTLTYIGVEQQQIDNTVKKLSFY
jgi:integrase